MIVTLQEIEERMRPGRFSEKGFLGPQEQLTEVLAADAQTLAELNLSAVTLAQELCDLFEPVVNSGRSTGRVRQFNVRLIRYKGMQVCPFAPDPVRSPCSLDRALRFGSIDWRVRNRNTHEELHGPGLAVHLIGQHSFFEGPKSPYRVDPRALARLFEHGTRDRRPLT